MGDRTGVATYLAVLAPATGPELSRQWWWSAALSTIGLAGLYLAGRSSYWGWLVSLVGELVWIAYGLRTGQPSFAVSALAYGWVYARNLRAWWRARPNPRDAQTRTDRLVRAAARPPTGGPTALLLVAVMIAGPAPARATPNADPATAAPPGARSVQFSRSTVVSGVCAGCHATA